MTVRDYLTFVARIKGIPGREVKGRVDEAMKRTYTADMASRHCGKLSKGYRQRVGLAQAIIHNPEVLILDEPTAGLDPKQIIETRDLIRSLAGDHTIVLSTHILPEVSQTCQRVVIINKGRVVAVDSPENLTARLRGAETLYVQVDGTPGQAESLLTGLPGVTKVTVADKHQQFTGFEIESFQDFNHFAIPGWWLNGKMLKRRHFSRSQLKVFNMLVPVIRRIDPHVPGKGLGLIAVARKS
jgi:ABC-2 type transport system ATP-binding protein